LKSRQNKKIKALKDELREAVIQNTALEQENEEYNVLPGSKNRRKRKPLDQCSERTKRRRMAQFLGDVQDIKIECDERKERLLQSSLHHLYGSDSESDDDDQDRMDDENDYEVPDYQIPAEVIDKVNKILDRMTIEVEDDMEDESEDGSKIIAEQKQTDAERMLKAKLQHHVSNDAYKGLRDAASDPSTWPSQYYINKVTKQKKEKLKQLNHEVQAFTVEVTEKGKKKKLLGVRTSLTELLRFAVQEGIKAGSIKPGDELKVRLSGDGRDLGKRSKNNNVVFTFTLMNLDKEHIQKNIHTILLLQGSENRQAMKGGEQLCSFFSLLSFLNHFSVALVICKHCVL
jgi:hypothetical protein